MGNVGRRAKERPRGSGYPYDRDNGYGHPTAYDRGSSGAGPSNAGLTPRYTDHTVWDDLDEVLGSPVLLTRAYQGTQANSIPGSSRGWAGDPPKFWDDVDESSFDPSDAFEVDLSPDLSILVTKVVSELVPRCSAWNELLKKLEIYENISRRKGR